VPDTAAVYRTRRWDVGPSANASWSWSHDSDSLAYFRNLTGSIISLWIKRYDPVTHRLVGDDSIASVDVGPPATAPGGYGCIMRLPQQCLDSIPVGTGYSRVVSAPVFSPAGDRVLFTVGVTASDQSVSGSYYRCPHTDTTFVFTCADSSGRSAGSRVYGIPLRGTKTPVTLASDSVAAWGDLTAADGRREFALNATVATSWSTTVWNPDTVGKQDTHSNGSKRCWTEFRTFATPTSPSRLFSECGPGHMTFSPNVAVSELSLVPGGRHPLPCGPTSSRRQSVAPVVAAVVYRSTPRRACTLQVACNRRALSRPWCARPSGIEKTRTA
jgi:hypothetical protein